LPQLKHAHVDKTPTRSTLTLVPSFIDHVLDMPFARSEHPPATPAPTDVYTDGDEEQTQRPPRVDLKTFRRGIQETTSALWDAMEPAVREEIARGCVVLLYCPLYTRARSHTRTHAHARARARTHTHTHTHTTHTKGTRSSARQLTKGACLTCGGCRPCTSRHSNRTSNLRRSAQTSSCKWHFRRFSQVTLGTGCLTEVGPSTLDAPYLTRVHGCVCFCVCLRRTLSHTGSRMCLLLRLPKTHPISHGFTDVFAFAFA
jgi:hypothetical protein